MASRPPVSGSIYRLFSAAGKCYNIHIWSLPITHGFFDIGRFWGGTFVDPEKGFACCLICKRIRHRDHFDQIFATGFVQRDGVNYPLALACSSTPCIVREQEGIVPAKM